MSKISHYFRFTGNGNNPSAMLAHLQLVEDDIKAYDIEYLAFTEDTDHITGVVALTSRRVKPFPDQIMRYLVAEKCERAAVLLFAPANTPCTITGLLPISRQGLKKPAAFPPPLEEIGGDDDNALLRECLIGHARALQVIAHKANFDAFIQQNNISIFTSPEKLVAQYLNSIPDQ